jgi:DNA mismatch repair protein MutS
MVRRKPKSAMTPMMAQYMKIRDEIEDALLFYRMGDFYELFFDDAVQASAALNIALTKRGQHLGEDIPMCGVPVHAAEGYLLRLIEKGFRVAICEQMENPAEAKKRGPKSVVRRAMVRLVTPGTLTEESLLDARSANRLLAINQTAAGGRALAWADISTGEFSAMSFPGAHGEAQMNETLVALAPKEVLFAQSTSPPPDLETSEIALTAIADSSFRVSLAAEKRLAEGFGASQLDGFGEFDRAERGALIALYEYISLTQAGAAPRLQPPVRHQAAGHLAIDPATRRSLEITKTLTGSRKGSLLAAVDKTVSVAGARVLADRLERPSTDRAQIERWLSATSWLVDAGDVVETLKSELQGLPDLSRSFSRLLLGRGGPRDLLSAARAIVAGETINALFLDNGHGALPEFLEESLLAASLARRPQLSELCAQVRKAFIEAPGLYERDGGFVQSGWSAALDEQRDLSKHSRKRIAELQGRYVQGSGIASLKIKHNNVLGYFVEVTPRHAQILLEEPHNEVFRHRQTLASAVRFSTEELSVLEAKILSASDRALALEKEIYADFLQRLLACEADIQAIANALAVLDVLQSSARWAVEEQGVRPKITENCEFDIKGGRHPVVEQALRADGQQVFTPNDCQLGLTHGQKARLVFVTGPNMAGKSTWLRQNALMVILVQAGLFVPAASARIGMVDRLFSRVGASDDLSRGRSTFMVEMTETAAILNQASENSFVILDEIGRGTATWDGLAIAWATAEHLQGVNQCRALFATHYHELTALAGRLPFIANVSLSAREWEGDLVFLHTVVAGAADRSYGIQVAKLSGMPDVAIQRARQVLQELETSSDKSALADELPLFATRSSTPDPVKKSQVEKRLRAAQIDDMSPRDALEFVYDLRAMVERDKP